MTNAGGSGTVNRAGRRRAGRRDAAVLAVAMVTAALLSAPVLSAGQADAQPGRPSQPAAQDADFYSPPAHIPATPGAVLRSQAEPLLAAIPRVNGPWPGTALRVMYVSRTESGTPTAVTGTFIDATRPWQGRGPRPTVVIAPGTMGQGAQCAPSRAVETGVNLTLSPLSLSVDQEAPSILAWNALGARVFVTDYIGLGTPGTHTYVNRLEEAHAVLDAARAANALSGTGPGTPLGLWGYSQGGGATAAAAELQPDYAPELNLKGTWAGAPPADLNAVMAQVDGNLIGGVIGYAINGMVARHPELEKALRARVTPAGLALLNRIGTECIGDIVLREPFLRTSALTKDHRSILDNLRAVPEAAPIIEQQRIGTGKPTSPVLITSGINDDTVPYGQAHQLAVEWCAKGAAVTFHTDPLPPILPGAVLGNHFGPELIDGYRPGGAISYLTDRFDDKPTAGCQFD